MWECVCEVLRKRRWYSASDDAHEGLLLDAGALADGCSGACDATNDLNWTLVVNRRYRYHHRRFRLRRRRCGSRSRRATNREIRPSKTTPPTTNLCTIRCRTSNQRSRNSATRGTVGWLLPYQNFPFLFEFDYPLSYFIWFLILFLCFCYWKNFDFSFQWLGLPENWWIRYRWINYSNYNT